MTMVKAETTIHVGLSDCPGSWCWIDLPSISNRGSYHGPYPSREAAHEAALLMAHLYGATVVEVKLSDDCITHLVP